jgi:DNA-binding MarR family transcriptional regulator
MRHDPLPDLDERARRIDDDLSAIRRAMRSQLNDTYESGGLTAPQKLAMAVLLRRGPLSVKEIAEAMNLGHSTVSGVMQRLEARDFVVRQPARDRRVSLYAPSEHVTRFVKSVAPGLVSGPLAARLANVSPEDLNLIEQGLKRLREIVEA